MPSNTVGRRCALVTGAGTSAGPSSGLPLGAAFDAMLLDCFFEAASRCAPNRVDRAMLEVLSQQRCNLVSRLSVHAGHETVSTLLECFRVAVPTEANLLSALLAFRGVPILTINISDGIERAYSLLAGESDLPSGVPKAYHRALAAWRQRAPVRGSLRVAAAGLGNVDLAHRPLLVRLRGSTEAGWSEQLLPSRGGRHSELDAGRLGGDALTALCAAAHDHLVVAGISGADRDVRATFPHVLRPGHFTWTCAEPDPRLVTVLQAIDPHQPVRRPAVEGIRSLLEGVDLPPWPSEAPGVPGFMVAFSRWRSRLSLHAAAATYADLLANAGLGDDAAAVRDRLPRSASGIRQVEAMTMDVADDGSREKVAGGETQGDATADPGARHVRGRDMEQGECSRW